MSECMGTDDCTCLKCATYKQGYEAGYVKGKIDGQKGVERNFTVSAKAVPNVGMDGQVYDYPFSCNVCINGVTSGAIGCRTEAQAQFIADKINADTDKLKAEIDQLRVQLAGCGVASLGYATGNNDCKKGDYGWSASFRDCKGLWEKYTALKADMDTLIDITVRTLTNVVKGLEANEGRVAESYQKGLKDGKELLSGPTRVKAFNTGREKGVMDERDRIWGAIDKHEGLANSLDRLGREWLKEIILVSNEPGVKRGA